VFPGAAEKKVAGDLASFSIFDITQMLLSGRKTAYVTVESGHRRGYVWFKDGQIVSATDDQLNAGEKAVFAIFSWRKGSFSIDFEPRSFEKNIQASTDFLLLDIARHFDEANRERAGGGEGDAGDDEQMAMSVEDRLNATLKSKLTTIFKTVAERTEPARDRYTRQAFDGLLGPLLELRGSALFIRRGLQPRVKTAEGFVTLKDAVIDANEVAGFLMATLGEKEAALLREQKEVSTLYDGGILGTFRVGVFEEDGAATILITPARQEIPELDQYGMGAGAEHLGRVVEGLVVVSGPLGSGKTSLLASLVAHHVRQRDKFAVVYSSEQLHAFPSGRGFVMQRGRPLGGAEFAKAVGGALDQGADLIAVDPVAAQEDLRLLLEIASTSRLVVAAMQTLSFGETLLRLQHMTQEGAQDRLGRLLAELLRAVIALPTRRPSEPLVAEIMTVGRDEETLLRKRDFAALRIQHTMQRV
jgi:twitching motility protein PilT